MFTPHDHARPRPGPRAFLSPGAALIAALAAVSAVAVACWPAKPQDGRVLMTFALEHAKMYRPIVADWNSTIADARRGIRVQVKQINLSGLERRMMAGIMSGTPVADLMEIERQNVGRAFLGPLDAVGFVDLTDRLKADGLLDEINAPSFSPWTNRGRIFGLPHDVHPVLLGYRADIVEGAGIDVSTIKTWDDFARVMRPLMTDDDHDGKIDHYLINMWDGNADHLELLLLQNGGGFFDESGRVIVNSPQNAEVFATVASWCVGPNRIAADAPNFTGNGNNLKAEGYVLSSFFPDWMCGIWTHEIPQLSGKMKLMPLPAWHEGGARTSVWGGTMLAIPKGAARDEQDFDRLFAFAKHLYTSDDLARTLWREGGIVTPVRKHWADPMFDEPNAYFSGQPIGRMYINNAPNIPRRASSPFNTEAARRVNTAFSLLCEQARRSGAFDKDALLARAATLLTDAHNQVQALIDRNAFLSEAEPAGKEAR